MPKVLMMLTSHDRLGNTGKPTGFWLEEFAAPYYVLRDAGVDITLASPKGGQPPVDPKSDEPGAQTPAMKRFRGDPEAQRALANTVKLSSVSADDYDAVFFPGGHGPLWDLAEDRDAHRAHRAAVSLPGGRWPRSATARRSFVAPGAPTGLRW